MKRWIPFLILFSFALSLTVSTHFWEQDLALSGEVVRLHVIAASDDERDQRVKLQVRDAVLTYLQTLPQPQTASEAVQLLEQQLPELAASAALALHDAGAESEVSVRLCREEYPTRDYGTFVLPAGEYVSLQVRLGEAKGKNWWCVVYPTLCSAAETDGVRKAAAEAGFSKTQLRLITMDGRNVQFRLKCLEWLRKIAAAFRTKT